jgi:glycosyltransferase involved in cell wall biosynthesis
MKKNIIIISFDMEVGGVERSLASMLNNFDYNNHEVDLHLHSHTGPLLDLLPQKTNLLPQLPTCKSYRQSIKQILLSGYLQLFLKRLFAKCQASKYRKTNQTDSLGYFQMQEIWRLCVNNTQTINENYDVAISYLWPHHFTAFNVKAKTKIAWIHTDYSTIEIDIEADLVIWQKFDHIISISNACTQSFLKIHPSLKNKIVVVENITSPEFVKKMAEEPLEYTFLKGDFNLVSVGRICDAKAFDRAVDVLNVIHERGFTNIKWYIVGEGGDRSKVKTLITKYNIQDSFVLLGCTTNPYPYMKAADLYVQPSRYEGKAVTIAEAQILAKPILITNYSTSASQIIHNIDGIICEQSIDDIADAIIKLFQDDTLRSDLSTHCKKQDYSNKEELASLYDLFD